MSNPTITRSYRLTVHVVDATETEYRYATDLADALALLRIMVLRNSERSVPSRLAWIDIDRQTNADVWKRIGHVTISTN